MRFLAWHLGLGDAIAFAGLAVRIASGGRLVVPCWEKNLVSVQSLFVHHGNIEVVVIQRDADMLTQEVETIRLGHYSGIARNPGEDMHAWVFRTAGEDVATRFDENVVACACKQPMERPQPPFEMDILVHDDPQRGFRIDRMPGNYRFRTITKLGSEGMGSILRWSEAIEEADEIHCIDSSFLHLVEQLQPTGRLFYHRYARPGSEAFTLRHPWIVLGGEKQVES